MPHNVPLSPAASLIVRVKNFAADECGAVTVDMMPIMMFAVSLGVVVTGEIADGVKGQSDMIAKTLAYGLTPEAGGEEIFGALKGWGTAGEQVASVDEGATADDPAEPADPDDTAGSSSGNPGNDRDVGNAGENPNGSDGWGSGSGGRSDGDTGNGSGNNGNSGSGNNGGGNNGNGNSGNSGSGSSGSGNPGNDKDVGNAGENPNGSGGWGGGSKGRSDGRGGK